jgi:hypothetical protein
MSTRGNRDYIEKTTQELLEVARKVARPKAIYRVSKIQNKNEDSVVIDGVKFISSLLRINLDKVERVFPHVVTCGEEMDEVSVRYHNALSSYCFDMIKQTVLGLATDYLEDSLKTSYRIEQLSKMSPGDLEFWPITQQKELFSILGNVKELIGVTLTPNYMMIPLKSSSGIFYASEEIFNDCRLCTIEVCSERKSPYDPRLAQKYRQKYITGM